VLTPIVRRSASRAGGVAVHPLWFGVAVRDLLFVLLTLVIFGLLALVAKGADRL
jgi:hypothetical protein